MSFTESDNQPETANTQEERRVPFYKAFIPEEGNYVVPVIIGINVLVFIAMVISGAGIFLPDPETLVRWGANFKPVTLDGQWWRLLTSNYLHYGIIHLAFNMYALSYIGRILEPFLGKARFIAAYTATGIIGSAASLWWNDNAASAGASGAIFGVHGVFLALLTGNFFPAEIKNALLKNLLVFIGLNLMIGAGAGFDNAGHLGGVISGVLIGYLFLPGIKRDNKQWKWISIAVVVVITVALSLVAIKISANDVGVYSQRMEEFSRYEKEALSVNLSLTDKGKLLEEVNTKGIANWKKCLAVVESTDSLKLSPVLTERNALLKTYCKLRISFYEKLYLAISNDTNAYDKELETIDLKVGMTLKELNGE